MCIVFYTLSQPGYQLILASNRDEFFDRPAAPAAWHNFDRISGDAALDSSEQPWVLCGRDLGSVQGGTWIGMTRDLRIGALTRRTTAPGPVIPSRGLLLKNFLAPSPSLDLPDTHTFLHEHLQHADEYDGFNLLLFHLFPPESPGQNWRRPEVGYLSNRPEPVVRNLDAHASTSKGVRPTHGLSNSPMAQPWPKVTGGEERMEKALQECGANAEDEEQLITRMFGLMRHTVPITSISDLSECTCIPPWPVPAAEQTHADHTAQSRWYGTRVSTIIMVKDNGEVTFIEKDIGTLGDDGDAETGSDERIFRFNAISKNGGDS